MTVYGMNAKGSSEFEKALHPVYEAFSDMSPGCKRTIDTVLNAKKAPGY